MHLYIHPSPGHLSCTCIYRAISICPCPSTRAPAIYPERTAVHVHVHGRGWSDEDERRGGGTTREQKGTSDAQLRHPFFPWGTPRVIAAHTYARRDPWPWLFSWWIRAPNKHIPRSERPDISRDICTAGEKTRTRETDMTGVTRTYRESVNVHRWILVFSIDPIHWILLAAVRPAGNAKWRSVESPSWASEHRPLLPFGA